MASQTDQSKSYRAINHFWQALRFDSRSAPLILFNVAVVWGWRGHSLGDAESNSYCEAANLLVRAVEEETSGKASTCRYDCVPNNCTHVLRAKHGSVGALDVKHVSVNAVYQYLTDSCNATRADLCAARHLEARASLQCRRWAAATGMYAALLSSWTDVTPQPEHDNASGTCCSLGRIDHIHREYCLALLRAADEESQHGLKTADDTKKSGLLNIAISLCEHVLHYRPQDVLSLLMMAEARLALGQVQEARLPIDVATRIMEYARATELQSGGIADAPNLANVLRAAGLWSVSQVLPNLVRCYSQRGAVLWRLGRRADAIKSFAQGNRALVSDVSVQDVAFNLCASLWSAGLHKQAAQNWLPHRGWELGQDRQYYADALARLPFVPLHTATTRTEIVSWNDDRYADGWRPHMFLDRLVLSWQCQAA